MSRYSRIIDFLTRLKQNNHKDWFDQNRKEYLQVKEDWESLVSDVIEQISLIDPSIAGLTVKQCTYRINRDVRFSSNKEPYKTHMGAYIVPSGKKSGYAGYYLHLEPKSEQGAYLNQSGSFIAAGIYCPEPKVLKSIREEILSSGGKMMDIIDSAKGFELSQMHDTLKRTPRDFPANTPYDNMLRMKHFLVQSALDDDFFDDDTTMPKRLSQQLEPVVELITIINRAVQFAYEEM